MATSLTDRRILKGSGAVAIREINKDGSYPSVMSDALFIKGVVQANLDLQIERGERTVDRADGVGVIGIYEEDDTLIGVDANISVNEFDLDLLYLTLGGTAEKDSSGRVISWKGPTITEQRDFPKRFEVSIYIEDSSGGYVKHTLYYCRATPDNFTNSVGMISRSGLSLKARENPYTSEIHSIEYVSTIS